MLNVWGWSDVRINVFEGIILLPLKKIRSSFTMALYQGQLLHDYFLDNSLIAGVYVRHSFHFFQGTSEPSRSGSIPRNQFLPLYIEDNKIHQQLCHSCFDFVVLWLCLCQVKIEHQQFLLFCNEIVNLANHQKTTYYKILIKHLLFLNSSSASLMAAGSLILKKLWLIKHFNAGKTKNSP